MPSGSRSHPGDALLLGTDLVKPVEQLLAAYDDPTGVTAAFNLNLLARINRELDADFDLRQFEHVVRLQPGGAAHRDAPAVAHPPGRPDSESGSGGGFRARRNHLDRSLPQVPA